MRRRSMSMGLGRDLLQSLRQITGNCQHAGPRIGQHRALTRARGFEPHRMRQALICRSDTPALVVQPDMAAILVAAQQRPGRTSAARVFTADSIVRSSVPAQHPGLADGGFQGQPKPHRQRARRLPMPLSKRVELLGGGRNQTIAGMGEVTLRGMALPAWPVLAAHGGKEAVRPELPRVIAHGQQHRNQGWTLAARVRG